MRAGTRLTSIAARASRVDVSGVVFATRSFDSVDVREHVWKGLRVLIIRRPDNGTPPPLDRYVHCAQYVEHLMLKNCLQSGIEIACLERLLQQMPRVRCVYISDDALTIESSIDVLQLVTERSVAQCAYLDVSGVYLFPRGYYCATRKSVMTDDG